MIVEVFVALVVESSAPCCCLIPDDNNDKKDAFDTAKVPVNELNDKTTLSELFLYDISEVLSPGQSLKSTPSKLSVMVAGIVAGEAECGASGSGNATGWFFCEAINVGMVTVLVCGTN
jgi:hypothetical protein